MKNLKLVAAAVFLASISPATCRAAAIVWSGSSGGNWSATADWAGGVVPQSPGQAVDIPVTFAGTVNVDMSPSIGALNIDNSGTTLDILGGNTLTISGSLANNGAISVGNYAYLTFSGSQTLSGTGNVILNPYGYLGTGNSGVLTQAAGSTISGQGTINATLINKGLVNANVNGQTLTLAGSTMTNLATMEGSGGGLLTIENTINNAGGTILASGGSVQINGGMVLGGTLTSTGTSNLSFNNNNGSGGTLSGVTLSNGSQFSVLGYNGGNSVLTVANGIANNGTITVNSPASGYLNSLTFSGSQTLSGTGSVVLGGIYAELSTSNSGVLTQAAGHTISGQGTITAALINQGVVNANVSGGTLALYGNPMTNAGTMEATGGGVLSIQNTTVNNAGRTILASGGGNVQLGNAAINGGTLSSTGTSSFQVGGYSNVTSLNAITLSNGSQFNIASGAGLTVANGITNNGTITMDSDNGSADVSLTFSGSQTLSGSGSVILGGPNVQLMTSNSGVLTQAAGHTISGQGTINAALINQGLIEGSGGGLLIIENTINNAGGTILASGGSVQIYGGMVLGGTLTSTGTSNLSFNNNGSGGTLSGVTLSNGSQFSVLGYDNGNSVLTVANGIANNGTITVNSPASGYLNSLTFSGSQTLSGTGSVVLGGIYAELSTSNSGVLTQAAGHTISGQGTITAALINQGVVNANVSGGTLALYGNPMTNAGTMEATGGGVLSIQNTTVNNAGRTILASGGGNVQLGNAAINGGTLSSTGTSSFQVGGYSNVTSLNAITLSNGSQFNIASGAGLTVANGITNNGTITMDSDNGSADVSLTFSGSQTLSGSGSVILGGPNVQLNTSNSGVLTQAAGHTISGQGTINAALINQGLIEGSGGGLLIIENTINNAGGTILASGGSVQIYGGMVLGGTLTSTGTSNLSFNNNGSGGTLSGVTLSNGSQFSVLGYDNGNSVLTVANGIANNGTITVNSPASGYLNSLTFSGSQTLSGTGSVVLGGIYAELSTSNSGVLTQAAGHTISGQGTITAALINQGVVNANVSGGTLALYGNPMTNAGTMEATGGGVLSIQNTTVNNAGRTILASGGGNVQLGNAAINGGTLSSTGTSSFQVGGYSNVTSLNAITLSNGSQFNIASGAGLTVANGITNNGTITMDSDNGSADVSLTFSGSQTLSGSGSVILGGPNVQLMTSNSGMLTQAAGHTISGQGTINAALINQGLIEGSGGGLLIIENTINNAGGTILASGGSVQIYGGMVLGGTLTSTGTSNLSFNNNGSGGTVSGVTLSNGSQFSVLGYDNGNSVLTVANGIANNGTITVNSPASGYLNSLTFSGSQTLSGTGSVVLGGIYAELSTSNSGVLTQAAGHTISGQGMINAALNNLGTIEAQNGTLTVAGPVTQFSGGTLAGGTWIAETNSTLNVTSAGNFSTNQGIVILSGTGASFPNINALAVNQGSFTVAGGLNFTTSGSLSNSGTLYAGGGSTLTVAGNLTLTGGVLQFDLSSTGPSGLAKTTNLNVSSPTTIAINILGGALGNGSYPLIDYSGSLSGSLASLSLSGVASGATRQTFSLAASGSAPGELLLDVVNGAPANLVWSGSQSGTWDTAALNWSNSGTADKFYNGDAVTFNDTAGTRAARWRST